MNSKYHFCTKQKHISFELKTFSFLCCQHRIIVWLRIKCNHNMVTWKIHFSSSWICNSIWPGFSHSQTHVHVVCAQVQKNRLHILCFPGFLYFKLFLSLFVSLRISIVIPWKTAVIILLQARLQNLPIARALALLLCIDSISQKFKRFFCKVIKCIKRKIDQCDWLWCYGWWGSRVAREREGVSVLLDTALVMYAVNFAFKIELICTQHKLLIIEANNFAISLASEIH